MNSAMRFRKYHEHIRELEQELAEVRTDQKAVADRLRSDRELSSRLKVEARRLSMHLELAKEG